MLVLSADDDQDTCTLVAAILRNAGHTSIVARDALQVMSLAMARRPQLILLDIQMPAGTGVGALQKLKTSALTKRIPVIVLSGTADAAMQERVLQLGAVAFVPKPVDDRVLLDAIAQVTAPDASSTG